MASLTLIGVDVSLDKTDVLKRVSVAVPDGSFVAVVGPSGAGKSTLLRAVAGLVPVRRGEVLINGVDVTMSRPGDRDVSMLFQDPALLSRRNVARNVGLPLELRRQTAAEIRTRVSAEARSLQIEHLLNSAPETLSRGEQQLVQIARALVRVPQLLVLDEPLASLDQPRRASLRSELRMLQRGYGVTTLMATNDPLDAVTLADLVVVLGDTPATVLQVGAPREVYANPVDLDAARTLGDLSTLPVLVSDDGDGFWLSSGSQLRLRAWQPALASYVGANVTLGLRSDDLHRDERGEVRAVLERIVPGSSSPLLCRIGERRVMASGMADGDEVGATVALRVQSPLLFDPDTGRRIV